MLDSALIAEAALIITCDLDPLTMDRFDNIRIHPAHHALAVSSRNHS